MIVDEAFGIQPIDLKHIGDIEGQKIYGSSKLNEKYISIISEQTILKPIIKDVVKLIDKGLIVPCFVSSNTLKLILHKAFANPINKNTLGYYHFNHNKIYILMDNHTKLLMLAKNRQLGEVTIHELMHFSCKNKKNQFYNLFKDDFATFYSSFYNRIANIKLSKEMASKLAYQLLKKLEWGNVSWANLRAIAVYLDKNLKTADIIQKEKAIVDPFSIVKIYLSDPNVFVRLIDTDYRIQNVLNALYYSYTEIGIVNPNTMPIQEILWPSEIAAVSSVKPKSSHYQAVKMLI